MDSWIRAQELPKVQRTIQMALLFIFVKLLAGISRELGISGILDIDQFCDSKD